MDEAKLTSQYSGLSALYCPENGESIQDQTQSPVTEIGQSAKYLETNLHKRRGILALLKIRLGVLPTRDRTSTWTHHAHKYCE